jgi:RNAse (barnase) inhibitor barstar
MSKIRILSTGYYTENNTRYVFMDGTGCRKIENCYDSLGVQLSLPDYFGKNLDALDEVINDLEWIKEEKVKIIISSPGALLADSPGKKEAFLEILDSARNEKLEIIYLEEQEGL